MTIIEYGKLCTEFYTTEMTIEREAEFQSARADFIKRGKELLIIAIDNCVAYGKDGGSPILMGFIKETKLLLVDPTHKKLTEWLSNNPQQVNTRDNAHCLENLTIALLTSYVIDYIDTVYETLR
jgi:hypothetical protein